VYHDDRLLSRIRPIGASALIVLASLAMTASTPDASAATFNTSLSTTGGVLQRGGCTDGVGSSGLANKLQRLKRERASAVAADKQYAPSVVAFDLPVILGNFADNSHIFTANDFDTLMFGPLSSGSMADYYDEVSYGQFQLDGTVYGPYTAAETQAWYMNGDNGGGSDFPTNYAGFLHSVLAAADPSIDFSQYDNDGPDGLPNSGDDDGVVDALMVIYPDGTESTGDSDNFRAAYLSMAWHGAPVYTTDDARTGGGFIEIDRSGRVGAERGDGTVDQIQFIGIICHEFGHALGLPDLYDVDESSHGLGTWCLMSSSFGACHCAGGGARPVHLSAWCKAELGWVIPMVVNGTQAVSIPPVETNAVVYKLWDDGYQGSRYFLLENRTKTGFDADITGEGVLIWHCNDEICCDNSEDGFRLVDLEEADGLDQIDNKTSRMDAGDPFPGSTNNTTFDDASDPAAWDVFGNATGVSATGFTYVSGPGSDVSVTLTQRLLVGFTLAYHGRPSIAGGIGSASSQITHGALRFTSSDAGQLVAIQAVPRTSSPADHTITIYDDIVAGAPENLLSVTNGILTPPSITRYQETWLSAPLVLDVGQSFVVDVAWGPDQYALPYTRNEPISGESYWSLDGASYTNMPAADVLIRARVQYCLCPYQSDFDDDGFLTPLDMSAIIDILFAGATDVQDPSCPSPRSDFDCDGFATPLDLAGLIDHLFASDDGPCDPCQP
jgi:immune inhibitor A